jgi:hypothetical protein
MSRWQTRRTGVPPCRLRLRDLSHALPTGLLSPGDSDRTFPAGGHPRQPAVPRSSRRLGASRPSPMPGLSDLLAPVVPRGLHRTAGARLLARPWPGGGRSGGMPSPPHLTLIGERSVVD